MPLTIQDRLELTNLLNRLNFAVDETDPEAWAACYTEDGSFESPNGKWTGRAAQLELMEAEKVHPRRHHTITDLVLDGDGDVATGKANGAVFEEEGGVYRVMNFSVQEHHFRRVDGKWLLQASIRHRPQNKPA